MYLRHSVWQSNRNWQGELLFKQMTNKHGFSRIWYEIWTRCVWGIQCQKATTIDKDKCYSNRWWMYMGLVYCGRKSERELSEAFGATKQHQLTRTQTLFWKIMNRHGLRVLWLGIVNRQYMSGYQESNSKLEGESFLVREMMNGHGFSILW